MQHNKQNIFYMINFYIHSVIKKFQDCLHFKETGQSYSYGRMWPVLVISHLWTFGYVLHMFLWSCDLWMDLRLEQRSNINFYVKLRKSVMEMIETLQQIYDLWNILSNSYASKVMEHQWLMMRDQSNLILKDMNWVLLYHSEVSKWEHFTQIW